SLPHSSITSTRPDGASAATFSLAPARAWTGGRSTAKARASRCFRPGARVTLRLAFSGTNRDGRTELQMVLGVLGDATIPATRRPLECGFNAMAPTAAVNLCPPVTGLLLASRLRQLPT